MYEYLKVLFGTGEDGNPTALTYEQFIAKLTEHKEIKLTNLADGGYVSKEKFDAKETELTGVKDQLTAANATIQSYKDMDIDGIKQSAADWEKKHKEDTEALQQKLDAQARSHNEEMFLSGYKFSSKAARDGIAAEFTKKNFPYENGTFLGGKEFMQSLMDADDYKAAFVVEAPPAPVVPEQPKPQFSDPNPQPPQPAPKVGLAELMRRKNANPETPINYE